VIQIGQSLRSEFGVLVLVDDALELGVRGELIDTDIAAGELVTST